MDNFLSGSGWNQKQTIGESCCFLLSGARRNVGLDSNNNNAKLLPAFAGLGCLGFLRSLSLVLAVLICATILPLKAISQNFLAHEVKAVYLFNFASFVTWPQASFESDSQPLNYCLASSAQVEQSLAEALQGEIVKGRSLALRQLGDDESLSGCHILYFENASGKKLNDLLASAPTKGLLVVTDFQTDRTKPASINLLESGEKLSPLINLQIARANELLVSSKLLRIAQVNYGLTSSVEP